jgi:hypothetical protein
MDRGEAPSETRPTWTPGLVHLVRLLDPVHDADSERVARKSAGTPSDKHKPELGHSSPSAETSPAQHVSPAWNANILALLLTFASESHRIKFDRQSEPQQQLVRLVYPDRDPGEPAPSLPCWHIYEHPHERNAEDETAAVCSIWQWRRRR